MATVRGLFPERFESVELSLSAFAGQMDGLVLPALRAMAGAHVQNLSAPVGFRHRTRSTGERKFAMQQSMGPDPPLGDG